MKSLSLSYHVNNQTVRNKTYYLCQSQSQLLFYSVNGPLRAGKRAECGAGCGIVHGAECDVMTLCFCESPVKFLRSRYFIQFTGQLFPDKIHLLLTWVLLLIILLLYHWPICVMVFTPVKWMNQSRSIYISLDSKFYV